MNTILVPVDGSDHALKALHIACDLAEKYGGGIALLHVLAKDRRADNILGLATAKTFGPKLNAALQETASKTPGKVPEKLLKLVGNKILDLAASKVRRRGLEADVLEIATGDPADCILIAHKQTGASTIVMGCRGAGDSGTSSFGSVSRIVFEKATCTCLSVK
ncbi:MAG: universal stress protein [Methyloligellaceae bacterium]